MDALIWKIKHLSVKIMIFLSQERTGAINNLPLSSGQKWILVLTA